MWCEISYTCITTAKRYVKSNYGSNVLTLRGLEMLIFPRADFSSAAVGMGSAARDALVQMDVFA
jgi:hypothetical protein